MVIAVVIGVRECAKVHVSLAIVATLVAMTTFGASLDRSVRAALVAPNPDLAALRTVRDVGGVVAAPRRDGRHRQHGGPLGRVFSP